MSKILSDESKARVVKIVSETLNVDPGACRPSTTLDALGADSLDAAEICMAVEEEFHIVIHDEQWEGVSTINDIFSLVKEPVH